MAISTTMVEFTVKVSRLAAFRQERAVTAHDRYALTGLARIGPAGEAKVIDCGVVEFVDHHDRVARRSFSISPALAPVVL